MTMRKIALVLASLVAIFAGRRRCRTALRSPSARLFEEILADEEHYIDYLQTQLSRLDKLGEPLYVAQLVEQPSEG
jgi:bacterioferritin